MLGLFRRSRNDGDSFAEAKVRLARLEEDVHAQGKRLQALEDRYVTQVAAVHDATDKLERAIGRYRKQRAANSERADDGDAGNDWLAAYYALRGRHPGAAPVGPGHESVDEDGE